MYNSNTKLKIGYKFCFNLYRIKLINLLKKKTFALPKINALYIMIEFFIVHFYGF